ncbi:MAG TPA: ABC transporter permease, partial [Puia sp.]
MIKNYLKAALRNLWKNKAYSAINIFGLSVGIACSLLIIFHVREELSYDKNLPKADRLMRVTASYVGQTTRHWAATPPVM